MAERREEAVVQELVGDEGEAAGDAANPVRPRWRPVGRSSAGVGGHVRPRRRRGGARSVRYARVPVQLAIVSQRLERSSHGAAGGSPSVRKLVPSGEQIGEHVVVGINLVELGPRLARVSEARPYPSAADQIRPALEGAQV